MGMTGNQRAESVTCVVFVIDQAGPGYKTIHDQRWRMECEVCGHAGQLEVGFCGPYFRFLSRVQEMLGT